MTVRVTVADTWTPVVLAASPDEPVAALKLRALGSQGIAAQRAASYEVKLGGGVIRDETRTLAAAGVKDLSSLVLLSRHRRPVR